MDNGSKVVKLAIRFLTVLNAALRAQGADRNRVVAEAVAKVDLTTAPLIDIREPKDEETCLTLPAELMTGLKRAAKQRYVSLNVLVNTAVAHWLAGRRAIRLTTATP